MEESRPSEEPLLEAHFQEDVKSLFKMDDLKRMSASYINGTLVKGQRSDSAAKLVYEVDEEPVPALDQEWQLLEETA